MSLLNHPRLLVSVAGLCFAFTFMEVAKAYYFNGDNTPILYTTFYGLYLYLPWLFIAMLCGLIAKSTLRFPTTSREFLIFSGLFSIGMAFLHVSILTSAYWVFWPERVGSVTVSFVFGEQAMKWFHFELLACIALLMIWRRHFLANEKTPKVSSGEPVSEIAFSTEAGKVKLNINQIEWLLADDNYIIVHANDRKLRIRSTMKEMLGKLCNDKFKQTHRSAIVNLNEVKEIGSNRLTLKSGIRVPVSRRRHRVLMEAFSK